MLGKLFGAYITFFIAYIAYVQLRFANLVRKENPELANQLCPFSMPFPSWLRINDFVQLNKHHNLTNPKAVSLGEKIKSGFTVYAFLVALIPLSVILIIMVVLI